MSLGPVPLPTVRTDRFVAFSHVVSTRQGLYIVNESRCEQLADGAYFGLSLRAGALYAFERGPTVTDESAQGRILRLQLSATRDQVLDVTPVVSNLDGGCHQIDFIGGRLHVVDTRRQRLLAFDAEWADCRQLSPCPLVGHRQEHGGHYVHMNAIVARGNDIWVMLHNNRQAPSEIIRVDEQMNLLQRVALPHTGCHDIVPMEDGDLLYCGSDDGVIASTGGRCAQVVPGLMTRGLSVTRQRVVVGSSVFGPRHVRSGLPGVVSFFTRELRPVAHVAIPGSPTDILCIDEEDLSLSQDQRQCTLREGTA